MKTNFRPLRTAALALGLLMGATHTKAQIVNNDFQLPGVAPPNCPTAISGWAFGPTPQTPPQVHPINSPQYVFAGGNGWIDLTRCGDFGNGVWVEQSNIPTTPGNLYYVQMSLGAWTGWANFDAGADVFINGNPLNVGTNRLYNDVFGPTNPSWKQVRSCIFKANSSTITLRIQGNGQNGNPLSPDFQSGPGVIGLDDVSLVDITSKFRLMGLATGCNRFCYTLENLLPDVTVSNITWYVNNIPRSNTPSGFCWTYPKNIPTQLKVTFDIQGPCGAVIHELTETIVAEADCPCDLEGNTTISYVKSGCNTYDFSLSFSSGYLSMFTQWSVDGIGATGSLNQLTLSDLSPGSHTICATMLGGVEGETGNFCCARKCIVVNVPTVSIDPNATTGSLPIYYCPMGMVLTPPRINPCDYCNNDYFEFFINGNLVVTSDHASPCNELFLNGNGLINCYERLPGGVLCLKSSLNLVPTPMNLNTTHAPDQTIELCEQNSTAYMIDCFAPTYTKYELFSQTGIIDSGDLLPGIAVMPTLTVGSYTARCFNPETCTEHFQIVHIIRKEMEVSRCNIFVENCQQGLDENTSITTSYINLVSNQCPDCFDIIRSPNQSSPWTPVFYGGSPPYRIFERTFTDETHCKKCIVSATVPNAEADPGKLTIDTRGANCVNVRNEDLLECLRDKALKLFRINRPAIVTDIPVNGQIELCCNPSGGPQPPQNTFYLYSEDDPCCYMIITLLCSDGQGDPPPSDRQVSPGTTVVSGLKLIPNPTSSVFRIASNKGFETYQQVQISNLDGKILLTKKDTDSSTEFDVRKFAKGTYSVTVHTKAGVVQLKLIAVDE